MSPVIILHGNCQAEFMAGLLSAFPPISSQFKLVYSRSYTSGEETEPPRVPGEDLSLARLALIQSVDFRKGHPFPQLPSSCEVVTFPVLALGVLFPFAFLDPRNKPKLPNLPFGPFPIGDKIAFKVTQDGRHGDDAAAEYYRSSLGELATLHRHLEIETARLARLDAQSHVKVADYILDRFREEQLFHHWQHPVGKPMGLLLERIFATSDVLRPLATGADFRSLVEPLLDNRLDPFSEDQLPIHPGVAIGLRLNWTGVNPTYRVRAPFSASLTFDQFIRCYMNWDWSSD